MYAKGPLPLRIAWNVILPSARNAPIRKLKDQVWDAYGRCIIAYHALLVRRLLPTQILLMLGLK